MSRAVTHMMERYRREPREKAIRNYALHLALIVRRRGTMLALYEWNEPRQKIGEYRTWLGVERAIRAYGDTWLRENPVTRRQVMKSR